MPYTEIDRINGVIKLFYPTNQVENKKDDWENELNNYIIKIVPQNTITIDQMRLCYVLFEQFSLGTGWEDMLLAKSYLKAEFGNEYELGEFSISPNKKNCLTLEQATEFIQFIIEKGIEENMNLYILDKKSNIQRNIRDIVPDIQRYVISCLKSRRCCVCGQVHDFENGKIVELEHYDNVNRLGGYEHDDGLQSRFLSLCRQHHIEIHSGSKSEFIEKYHLQPVWLNEQLVYELLDVYPNHFKLFRKRLKEGYYGLRKEKK